MRAKGEFPNINDRRPAGKKEDGTSYRVLVVDDSIFVTKQIEQILTSEGFDVVGKAGNGEEGLEMYKELSPGLDLVTLDITMPKMDGVACLEKIVDYDKDARVIMVSALGKQELVKKALLLGAKNYIVKPLDRQKVLDRVVMVLK